MTNFKRIESRHGVPVFYKHLPVNSVTFHWVYFVGSADDTSVGRPGLYHWFEHVPFRGTEKYRNGYQSIDLPVARHGGDINASTTELATSFEISVPRFMWKQGLDMVSDVAFRPLIRDADVEAERDVIHKEIIACLSDVDDFAWDKISKLIYPRHPLGGSTIGTRRDLASMNAGHLRKAFRKGYDRRRLALIACGGLPPIPEFKAAVDRELERAPDHGLSERRMGAFHGPLPKWKGGSVEKFGGDFPSSIVAVLFQIPVWNNKNVWHHYMAKEMFWAGDLSSPMYRVLREERNLAYQISDETELYPGGGYWGFSIEATPRDEAKVIKAVWDVIKDRKSRSRERFEYVRDSIRGRVAMTPLYPPNIVESMETHLVSSGEALDSETAGGRLLDCSYKDVTDIMDTLGPETGRVFIMHGAS